jgi:hypothetical protein
MLKGSKAPKPRNTTKPVATPLEPEKMMASVPSSDLDTMRTDMVVAAAARAKKFA